MQRLLALVLCVAGSGAFAGALRVDDQLMIHPAAGEPSQC